MNSARCRRKVDPIAEAPAATGQIKAHLRKANAVTEATVRTRPRLREASVATATSFLSVAARKTVPTTLANVPQDRRRAPRKSRTAKRIAPMARRASLRLNARSS